MHAELITPTARMDLEHLATLPGDRRTTTLVNWLIGANEVRRALAEKVLCREREVSARLLVGKALARGTKDSRRVELLAAVVRLGLEVDVPMWFDLMAFSRRCSAEVQAQVAIVLRHCRPGGASAMRMSTADDSPEAVSESLTSRSVSSTGRRW
jgi:hypothetical protein